MASARRISGSASARRLVACSNPARLLRLVATFGMVRAQGSPRDGHRPAHQRLGLREAVGGLQQSGEVVEGAGHIRMVLAEAGFADGQRAAHKRLGLREPVGGLQQSRRGC